MKKVIFLLTFLTFSSISFSQVEYSIKGKVLTTKGEAPTGNVLVLNPVDSSFIKGTSFFGEVFEIEKIEASEVLLKLTSSLEFQDKFILVTHNGENQIDLGEIIVESAGINLDEIIVKSKRPVYIQRDNGTVEVLIQNTTLAASNSVNEILSKSPEIVSDEEGSLSVFGKGSAILYVDGKRITSSQLALISPSNVKKIEIIRNPSAKYDAEGAAVINITTNKQGDDGYEISLKQNATYSPFGGVNTFTSADLNYKKGKFSTNAFYSLMLGEERERLHTTRDRDANNVFLMTDLTTDWEYEYDNYSYYGLGMQLDISPTSYLSGEYSGFVESLGGKTISQNNILDDAGASFFKSDIDKNEDAYNNSLSLNYYNTIDTLGSKLFIGGQFSRFDIGADNLIGEENQEVSGTYLRSLKNILDLDINIFSGQTDFTKVFKNNDVLEIGAKYSYIDNNFDFDFLVAPENGSFEVDSSFSNDFVYEESVVAGYISYESSLGKKTNYSIGVRSEYTDYYLNIVNRENVVLQDNYINFFPNLSITQEFSNGQKINLSYTSRINRVPYQRLNPVLSYQDRYTSVQGNPNMLPQKRHSFEINTKIKKYRFKVGYNYTIDPFGQTAIRGDEPNSYILKRINYDDSHMFFSSLSRTWSNEWWSSSNTLSAKYTNISETDLGFERVEPRPNIYFYTNNRFDVMGLFDAELLFSYSGNNREGLHDRRSTSNVAITLEKSLFNKTLKCRLVANDIFRTSLASGNYNVAETDVYYNRRWSTNYYRFSVMYNFGKLKKVSYKNRAVGSSESGRAQ